MRNVSFRKVDSRVRSQNAEGGYLLNSNFVS